MPTILKTKNSVTATNAPSSLEQGELAVNITDKKLWVGNAATTPVQLLGAGASGTFGALTVTSLSDSGNLTFTGTGNRILGDFSNATNANRVLFQTSTTNAVTSIEAAPNGTSQNSQFIVGNSSDVANSSIGLFQMSSAGLNILSSNRGTGTFLPIGFYTSSIERLRIDTSGNVGIGTSSPVYQTQIYGSGQTTAALTDAGNKGGSLLLNTPTVVAGDGGALLIGAGGSGAKPFSAIKGLLTDGSNNTVGDVAFSTRNASTDTALTERVRITAGGNVGIGTSSPPYKLSVTNESFLAFTPNTAGLLIRNLSGENRIDSYNHPITANYPLAILGSYIKFSTSDAERMRIDSSGNVLVGATATSNNAKFFVTGSVADRFVRFNNSQPSAPFGVIIEYTAAAPNDTGKSFLFCADNSATRADIRSNGGLANYSANNVNLSDAREKTNVELAGSYLDKICAIPVKTFNYIDQNRDEDDGLTLGVIAQDVQAVAPELVSESDWGTTDEPKMRLAIYQTDLQYALMKAIQELKAELDSVKAELQTLKGN